MKEMEFEKGPTEVATPIRRVKAKQADAAVEIFRRKQVAEIIFRLAELLTAGIPWMLFICCFVMGGYTVMNASPERIIASGVFYVFALVFYLIVKPRQAAESEE